VYISVVNGTKVSNDKIQVAAVYLPASWSSFCSFGIQYVK